MSTNRPLVRSSGCLALSAVLLATVFTQRVAAQSPADRDALEEIIVTAGKQGAQPLQDVPASITVIDQARIEEAGIDDALDYLRTIPGLGFQVKSPAGGRDDIRGGRHFNLRGIESGSDAIPTTAFYLDDTAVPFMDPKLFDVARIEVLHGPQGTLYGANSMGGTIRIVTNQPDMNAFGYAGDISAYTTYKGAQSFTLNGMLNMPLVDDKVGMRAVAFFRNDGGYIDRVLGEPPLPNAVNATPDINDEKTWGARLLGKIQVSPRFSLTPAIFHQEIRVGDAGVYEPDFQDMSIYFLSVVPKTELNDFTQYSLGAQFDVSDHMQIYSSTSYFESAYLGRQDQTKRTFDRRGSGYGTAYYINSILNDTFAEELRLTYSAERWRGIIGGYYSDDNHRFDQYGNTELTGTSFTYYQTNGETQFALFGEATFDFTDALSLTAGARWFDGTQDQYTLYTDLLDAPEGIPYTEEFSGDAGASSFSPKVQLSYNLSSDTMVYTSASKGFRPGGPTSLVPATPPCLADLEELGISAPKDEFEPDSLWNYEVGTKASFGDHRVTTNLALYYIDWTGVQQSVGLGCGFTFVGNVGAAVSKGAELEFWTRATDALEITGSFGYTDAKFTETSEAVGVTAGDRFPLVPEITGSLSAQYTFKLPNGHEAFVRGDYQYVDSMRESTYTFLERPAYDSVNLRFSVSVSDSMELVLFADNVFDARPVMSLFEPSAGLATVGGDVPEQYRREITTVRPRAVGLTFRFRK